MLAVSAKFCEVIRWTFSPAGRGAFQGRSARGWKLLHPQGTEGMLKKGTDRGLRFCYLLVFFAQNSPNFPMTLLPLFFSAFVIPPDTLPGVPVRSGLSAVLRDGRCGLLSGREPSVLRGERSGFLSVRSFSFLRGGRSVLLSGREPSVLRGERSGFLSVRSFSFLRGGRSVLLSGRGPSVLRGERSGFLSVRSFSFLRGGRSVLLSGRGPSVLRGTCSGLLSGRSPPLFGARLVLPVGRAPRLSPEGGLLVWCLDPVAITYLLMNE